MRASVVIDAVGGAAIRYIMQRLTLGNLILLIGKWMSARAW